MEEIAAYVNKLAAEGQYDPRVDQLPYHTEPPPTKVEGFSGLERLRRTVEIFSDWSRRLQTRFLESEMQVPDELIGKN